ncbi:MAG: outer membrane lipoprotein-sorting protein [Thermodesulfobacteriota bacterium]|nr:outer membrane lipoprotein-sorting protein [Thermodesulfobacteriota bacterium]
MKLFQYVSINVFFTFVLLFMPFCLHAKQPSIEEIVNKTNHMAYYQGKDGRAEVSMVITDNQGRKRHRQFIILRMDEEKSDNKEKAGQQDTGGQRLYVYFLRPADVNKMVFMVWKHVEKDDDRWLYLPALDLVKRIAATDKRTSFAGSDFFYEDVSGRNIQDDIHELEEVTETYYVLKNTPKDPETVEFSYFTMWIHKGTFLPIKTVFYDKNGKEYRIYDALKVETIQGFPTVTASRMQNVKDGGETMMTYSRVEYDLGLPTGIFTERYLRRAPRKYLK